MTKNAHVTPEMSLFRHSITGRLSANISLLIAKSKQHFIFKWSEILFCLLFPLETILFTIDFDGDGDDHITQWSYCCTWSYFLCLNSYSQPLRHVEKGVERIAYSSINFIHFGLVCPLPAVNETFFYL